MRGSILNQSISGFFAYLGCYTVTYFVYCFSFPLKTEKKRAVVAAVLYSLIANIINLMPLVIVGNGIIPETTQVFIFNQFLVILTEVLLVLYLLKYIDRPWYKIYWLQFGLIAIAIFPVQKFFLIDQFMTFEAPYIAFLEINQENILQFALTVVLVPFLLMGLLIFIIRWCRKNIKFYALPQLFWIILNVAIGVYVLNLRKTYTSDSDTVSDPYRGISSILHLLTMIVIISVVVILLVDFFQKRFLQKENRLLKEQIELQYANYLEKQEMELRIQKLYHDIGNHIKTIQTLVNNGDMEIAKNYTSDLLVEYSEIRKHYYCEHDIVNAVLCDKGKRCEALGVHLDINIRMPKILGIRDIDLMSVFSNLLDNGIEACERNMGQDNYIKVRVGMIGDYLGIKVENSKPHGEHLEGKKNFKTIKKDKSMHGFGTKIIGEIVERYDGKIDYQISEDKVQAIIMLLPKDDINS